MKKSCFILVLITVLSCKRKHADPPIPGGSDLYFPKVKAIIQANFTISCHAPSKGFSQGMPTILEDDSDIVRSAFSIKSSVADNITPFNKRMPPSGALSATDIEIIKTWVAKGGTKTVCGTNHR